MSLITAICRQCQRHFSFEDPKRKDEETDDLVCVYCYALFPGCNGGIDWRTDDKEKIKELKDDIKNIDRFRDGDKYNGYPVVMWPEGGMDFVENLIDEVKAETEIKDGKHR